MAEKRKNNNDDDQSPESKKLKISHTNLDLYNKHNKPINLDLILKEYDIIETPSKLKKEELPSENLCIGCGRDIGKDNPRQYCRKTYCELEN